MRLAMGRWFAAAGLICQAGCGHVQMPGTPGRDFPVSAFGGFVLNRTSEAEALASLGPPLKRSQIRGIAPPNSRFLAPGSAYAVTTMNYQFIPYSSGRPWNRQPSKLALLSFFNDQLVFYIEYSLLPGEENPGIDESRLAQLRQGETTRQQVIAMLGTPNIQFLHVLDSNFGSTEIGYIWGGQKSETAQIRTLTINFDRHGKLTTYTLVDRSNPAGTLPIPLPTPQAPSGGPAGLEPIPPGDLSHT